MKYLLRLDSKLGIAAPLLAICLAGGTVGQAQGWGFAQMMGEPALLMHSHAQSYLGIDIADVDQDRATALHLRAARGAEITILDHDAPAAKAGLRLHDVITQINGKVMATADDVKQFLRGTAPGRKLQLQISREGTPQSVTVQMADRRKLQQEALQQLGGGGGASTSGQGFFTGGGDLAVGKGSYALLPGSSLHIGAMVEPLTAQMAEFLDLSGGVMVKSVARKTAADVAGLKPHDVILGIGGEPVSTTSDWERLIRTSEGKPVQVEILRDRTKQLVLLQVDGKRHKN